MKRSISIAPAFTLAAAAVTTPATVRQLADEVADAMVWGGLRWRLSTDDGTRIGRAVARSVLRAAGERDD